MDKLTKIIVALMVGIVIGAFIGGQMFIDNTVPVDGNAGGVSFEDETIKGSVTIEGISGSATTSLVANKICITTKDEAGSTLYFYVASTGDWATTTTSCL